MKTGQPAEVIFKVNPRVIIVDLPFDVPRTLDENTEVNLSGVLGGTAGRAAIYTENAKAAHLIGKVALLSGSLAKQCDSLGWKILEHISLFGYH